MGAKALETAIAFWKYALAAQQAPSDISLNKSEKEEIKIDHNIQNLIEESYMLQQQSRLLFEPPTPCRCKEALTNEIVEDDAQLLAKIELIADEDGYRTRGSAKFGNVSESDFQVPNDEVYNAPVLQECCTAKKEMCPLYQEALKRFNENSIDVRKMRTEMLFCSDDTEFLVKLFCIRQAFEYLFKDPINKEWVCTTGRDILTDLLRLGFRDPKDFIVVYDDMINYVQNAENWSDIKQELKARCVKEMNFYDICFDLFILDAFEDLDNPPAAVLSVIHNRFLPNPVKKTALSTAIWTVLKSKKQTLDNPDGFMSHFYVIAEEILPTLAWGFFGTDKSLREICVYFRDQLLELLADIFSCQRSRYTTVEELSQDIITHMRRRAENIGELLEKTFAGQA